jgi:hypothetical protein
MLIQPPSHPPLQLRKGDVHCGLDVFIDTMAGQESRRKVVNHLKVRNGRNYESALTQLFSFRYIDLSQDRGHQGNEADSSSRACVVDMGRVVFQRAYIVLLYRRGLFPTFPQTSMHLP